MRDKRKSRLLHGCRLGLSAMALGQFIARPGVLATTRFQVSPAVAVPGEQWPRNADQARHRHHRREPQLRPRVRHLRAEDGRDRPQSALRRHHQARRQQERDSGTELPEGASAGGAGSRFDRPVPAEPAEDRLSRTTSCRPRWSADRRSPTSPNDAAAAHDHALRGELDAGGAVGIRAASSYYQYLVSGGTGQTRRRPTSASATSIRCRPDRSS